MENQFTTLTQSYYDNFLQYKLTGNESYQKAYMSADQGIQTLLSSLRGQVGTKNNEISNFYNSDIQNKLKNIKSDLKSTQESIVTTKDKLTAAEMRQRYQQPTTTTVKSTVPTSYIAGTAILLIIGALLTAM